MAIYTSIDSYSGIVADDTESETRNEDEEVPGRSHARSQRQLERREGREPSRRMTPAVDAAANDAAAAAAGVGWDRRLSRGHGMAIIIPGRAWQAAAYLANSQWLGHRSEQRLNLWTTQDARESAGRLT
jgi:hypothetical protein